MRLHHLLALATLQIVIVRSFTSPWLNVRKNINTHRFKNTILLAEIGEAELKSELTKYLEKRKEAGADEAAKA